MITWSQARATFGQGVPSDGSRFDQSSQFRQLQNQVESAAPGSRRSGDASDSYADANANHARKLGNIGELDQRLGAEVQRSAAVVTAGRRDLEAVKQWVSDAAAAVPNTAAGQRMLWPIVSKGSAEIWSWCLGLGRGYPTPTLLVSCNIRRSYRSTWRRRGSSTRVSSYPRVTWSCTPTRVSRSPTRTPARPADRGINLARRLPFSATRAALVRRRTPTAPGPRD